MQAHDDMPPLDRWRLDQMLETERRIVGADSIAALIGIHPRTLRRWVCDPAMGVPVRKVGGRLSAQRSELTAWLRGRPPA